MKHLLAVLALIITLSAYSQPSKEKLKAAIEKIERTKHSKDGEKVTYLRVMVLNYSVIPMRNYWKELMDMHLSFGEEVDSFLLMAKNRIATEGLDSTQRKEMEEKLKAFETEMTADSSNFDYVAYFKKRYDETPPTKKVYEVKYKIKLQTNKGDFSSDDYYKMVLNMKDLTDADVR